MTPSVGCGGNRLPFKTSVARLPHALNSGPGPWEPCILTRKVLVTTIDAQWEGMGDVGSARYEPALLPPCPTIRVFKLL